MYLGAAMALEPGAGGASSSPTDRHPMHWLAAVALCALAVSSNYTGVVRLRAVVRALRAKEGAPPAAAPSGPGPLRAQRARRRPGHRGGLRGGAVAGLDRAGRIAATAAGCAGRGPSSTSPSTGPSPSAATAAPLPQAGRYALVSLTSLALNTGGVSVLLSHPGGELLRWPGGWSASRSSCSGTTRCTPATSSGTRRWGAGMPPSLAAAWLLAAHRGAAAADGPQPLLRPAETHPRRLRRDLHLRGRPGRRHLRAAAARRHQPRPGLRRPGCAGPW